MGEPVLFSPSDFPSSNVRVADSLRRIDCFSLTSSSDLDGEQKPQRIDFLFRASRQELDGLDRLFTRRSTSFHRRELLAGDSRVSSTWLLHL